MAFLCNACYSTASYFYTSYKISKHDFQRIFKSFIFHTITLLADTIAGEYSIYDEKWWVIWLYDTI